MNIVSHIVYPVVFAQSANLFRTQKQQASFFNWRHLLLIGLFGGLPDILSPHIGLGARYSSFTHSIWLLLAALPPAFLLARRFQGYGKLIFSCYFAVVFHHFCDMIAGGINLFAPFGEKIVGRYYVPTRNWVPLDITGILLLSILLLSNTRPVRARPLVLVSGLALAIGGAGTAFYHLDTQTFFLKRVPAWEINSGQLEEARRILDGLFEKWQARTFEPLPAEFTEEMRQVMTPQWQKSFFEQLVRSGFGDYEQITFSEALTGRFYFPRILLYRFKGSFTRKLQQPEIGIGFDSNGRVSLFRWTPEYSDRLLDY